MNSFSLLYSRQIDKRKLCLRSSETCPYIPFSFFNLSRCSPMGQMNK